MSKSSQQSEPRFDPRMIRQVRRVVTGHDARGRSTILADGISPHVMPFVGVAGFTVTDLWSNASTPADNSVATAADPCALPIDIKPPAGGSVFRVTQFPPEKTWHQGVPGDDVHPHMHRTQTLDYAIVLAGEVWAVMEEDETLLRAGDVVVQRGTRHAWANRSDAPCTAVFVMIDALALQ